MPRWVLSGHRRVVRFNPSGDRCHVIEGAENIDFIEVKDEIEALLLLGRYLPGVGKAR